MRNRDKPRLGTIRLALAELKRVEIDERSICDERALAVLDKMVKQRRDAIVLRVDIKQRLLEIKGYRWKNK